MIKTASLIRLIWRPLGKLVSGGVCLGVWVCVCVCLCVFVCVWDGVQCEFCVAKSAIRTVTRQSYLRSWRRLCLRTAPVASVLFIAEALVPFIDALDSEFIIKIKWKCLEKCFRASQFLTGSIFIQTLTANITKTSGSGEGCEERSGEAGGCKRTVGATVQPSHIRPRLVPGLGLNYPTAQ